MVNLFLKNTSTKWQSDLIDLHSAMTILNPQTIDQVKNWLIFVDDGSDVWLNILDCPLIVEQLKQPLTSSELSAAFKNPESDLDLPQEFFSPPVEQKVQTGAHLENSQVVTEEELKGAERRLHPRFDIKLRVIIKSGKSTFLSYTQDVSLGGLSLINDVPEYIYNSEAEVYITAPDQKNNIMFTCSPVASRLGKSRLMFTKIEESKQKLLASWLQHFVKPNAVKVS